MIEAQNNYDQNFRHIEGIANWWRKREIQQKALETSKLMAKLTLSGCEKLETRINVTLIAFCLGCLASQHLLCYITSCRSIINQYTAAESISISAKSHNARVIATEWKIAHLYLLRKSRDRVCARRPGMNGATHKHPLNHISSFWQYFCTFQLNRSINTTHHLLNILLVLSERINPVGTFCSLE